MQEFLPNWRLTDRQLVARMSTDQLVDRAIKLLKLFVPPEGYYVAFSGGKDSCAVKKLCQLAEVKFDDHYNNTTIDPPELVRFIKHYHPETKWENPALGNMLHQISVINKTPPTRSGRWCCELYKEGGGAGRFKVFGVRAAESPKRRHYWNEVGKDNKGCPCVCPVVYWSTQQLWAFIRAYKVPYCSLYDEGFERLGCVGCMLASKKNQDREFKRWPKYEQNWKKAIIGNWEKWHEVPNSYGEPRYHAKFATGEDFWNWWRNGVAPEDPEYKDCQSKILWTNEEGD